MNEPTPLFTVADLTALPRGPVAVGSYVRVHGTQLARVVDTDPTNASYAMIKLPNGEVFSQKWDTFS